MKVCSQCHDEYRDDINTCLQCAVPLEFVADGAPARLRSKAAVEEIDLASAVKIFDGPLEGCREIETLLGKAKIACALIPFAGKFAICINADKVESYAALMQSRFDDMVAREHSASFHACEVNLDGEEVACPACSFLGALVDGQCADCGLTLGIE